MSPTPTLPLLTWQRPYIVQPTKRGLFRTSSPVPRLALTEFDLMSQSFFDTLLTQWCVNNNYLRPQGLDQYETVVPRNTGSLNNVILLVSFRSLTKRDTLEAWIESIADKNDDQSLDQLICYIPTLVSEVDPHYIDLYINRIYRGLDAVQDPNSDLRWSDIHRMYPFLWLVYAVQQKMLRWSEVKRVAE